MTDIFNESTSSIPRESVSIEQKDNLIHVLLYDVEYMAAHEARHPGVYTQNGIDYIEDSRNINEEIKQAVLEHPRIDPRRVRFFTDPYRLISDVTRKHDHIKCILNFCDDFSDRDELWSMPILFELFKLPCCGYGAKGLLSHNKLYAYMIAKQIGVPVPDSYYVTRETLSRFNFDAFPAFVKPNDAGGSEGISFRSVAYNEAQLKEIINDMLGSFTELLACEYLPGDEITIALLRRRDEIIPLAVKQIQFTNFHADPTIYTSDFKWNDSLLGDRKLVVKMFDGDPAMKQRLVDDSIMLFNVFGCKDFARLDWKCDAKGQPKFIDFNENPMYGADASFLWCLEHAGLSRLDLFSAMIDNVLDVVDRARDNRNRTGNPPAIDLS